MKIVFIGALLMIGPAVFAQQNVSRLSKSVNDDGKLMTVSIDAVVDNKTIEYRNSFQVEGLSKWQRDSIVRRVSDSLGIVSRKKTIKI